MRLRKARRAAARNEGSPPAAPGCREGARGVQAPAAPASELARRTGRMLSLARRVVYRHWQRFHGVRRLELATLSRYLELSRGQRILDVGSGKGAFVGTLARRGLDAVGVDPSLGVLSIAKRWVDREGRFLGAAGESLPLAAGAF